MADVGGDTGGSEGESSDSPAGRRMLAENGIVRPADFTSRTARGEPAGADDPNDDATGRVEPDADGGDAARSNGTSDADPVFDNRIEEGGADLEDLFAEDLHCELIEYAGSG